MKIDVPGTDVKKCTACLARKIYFFCTDKVYKHYLILKPIYGSFHLLFDTICDPINVPSNYVPRTEKVKKSPDASCQTIFTMPLICNCQTKRDIAEWVCDVGKTLLMWLWFVRMVDEDLDVPPWSPKERRWGAEGGVLPMLMWWTSLTTWFRILMTNKITTEKIVCVG